MKKQLSINLLTSKIFWESIPLLIAEIAKREHYLFVFDESNIPSVDSLLNCDVHIDLSAITDKAFYEGLKREYERKQTVGEKVPLMVDPPDAIMNSMDKRKTHAIMSDLVPESYDLDGSNNEDVISSCEGDCQAVFSMLLLNLLTGSKSFMANTAYIDIEKNDIVFAHCTIPTDMTEKYILRNHFESRIGVGIQGIVEEGPVTVFKCGGSKLDKYFVSSGQLVGNLEDDNMCRTQLKLHLNSDADYFLKNPLANHHLVVKGDHSKIINRFMHDMGCWRVM